jgi:hypothetical protein
MRKAASSAKLKYAKKIKKIKTREKKMTTKLNLDRCTSSLGVVDAGCLRWLVGGAGRRVVGVP